jgi:hypothetical protein
VDSLDHFGLGGVIVIVEHAQVLSQLKSTPMCVEFSAVSNHINVTLLFSVFVLGVCWQDRRSTAQSERAGHPLSNGSLVGAGRRCMMVSQGGMLTYLVGSLECVLEGVSVPSLVFYL